MKTEMLDKMSVTQSEWQDKFLPSDNAHTDPRWQRVEIAEGVFMWQWQPATVDYLAGAFVAQVGADVERFPDLEGAAWWCTDIKDVLPVVSVAAQHAPAGWLVQSVVKVAALAVSFALALLPWLVL